ncbi:MAG: DUF3224 domain-containing protein [Thermoplasmata archaeon]
MRKILLTSLTVLMVALLTMAWMPVVQATNPTTVSGRWEWMAPVDSLEVTKIADGNLFISAVEIDEFTGTLEGNGMGTFTVVVHPEGFATGNGRTIFTGAVQEKAGTLEIQWTGNTRNDLGYWWFHWVIVSGTGELANLRGQGTGFGPGPAGPGAWGSADLSGKIHFAPN